MNPNRETVPPWVRAQQRRVLWSVFWHGIALAAWLGFLWLCLQALLRIKP